MLIIYKAEGERRQMFSSGIPFDVARSRAESHRNTQKAADESYTYLLIKVKCIFSLSKHWTMSELAATSSLSAAARIRSSLDSRPHFVFDQLQYGHRDRQNMRLRNAAVKEIEWEDALICWYMHCALNEMARRAATWSRRRNGMHECKQKMDSSVGPRALIYSNSGGGGWKALTSRDDGH